MEKNGKRAKHIACHTQRGRGEIDEGPHACLTFSSNEKLMVTTKYRTRLSQKKEFYTS